ncbi:GNAT family N-acetyltransferase [Solibacillus sp.]|uniref:GNAT family N-acetyltransferase n=1 Tax=Solibacillus sp. TaxID=1909654 RepID=UPI003315702E
MDDTANIPEQYRTLHGERITLRPFRMEDLNDLFEFTADEEATRYLYAAHKDIDQTERLLTNYYLQEPYCKYAVELNDTKKMIGTFEFRIKEYDQNAELGYTLTREYWGNGYMSEAIDLVLDIIFNKVQLARAYAEFDVRNEASGKLLTRAGMQRDGVLRKNRMVNGVLTDTVHCSILREEYVK